MITDYFMITEKSNQLQVIVITDYDYPISGVFIYSKYCNDNLPDLKMQFDVFSTLFMNA